MSGPKPPKKMLFFKDSCQPPKPVKWELATPNFCEFTNLDSPKIKDTHGDLYI